MWIVKEGSLARYFDEYITHLRRNRFKFLLVALIRDADAPTFYDDLHRYWESLDDVTGPNLVFAVAGPDVATEFVLNTAIHGDGPFRYNLNFGSFSNIRNQRLLHSLGSLKVVQNRKIELTQLDAKMSRPSLEELSRANTNQVSELAGALGLREADLPCLHLTSLLGNDRVSTIISLRGAPEFSIYTACKNIVEHFGSGLHQTGELPQSKRATYIADQLAKLRGEADAIARQFRELAAQGPTERELNPLPIDLEMAELVGSIVDRFGSIGLDGVVAMLCHPERTKGRFRRARSKIESLERRDIVQEDTLQALQKIEALASEGALPIKQGEARSQQMDRTVQATALRARSDEIARKIATSEEEQQEEERQRQQLTLQSQVAVRDALRAKFSELGRSAQVVKNSREQSWNFFISYASADRSTAVEVFRTLESFGRTFLDCFCLLPGDPWRSRIQDIQSRSAVTIALISRRSFIQNSTWYQTEEIERAINLNRSSDHIIIPVYIGVKDRIWFGLSQLHSIFVESESEVTDKLSMYLRTLPSGSDKMVEPISLTMT